MASPTSPDPPADAGDNADITSSPLSLHRAVHARRAEYIRPHRMRVKVGTWNVAACAGTDRDLANWFVSGKGIDKRLATLDVARNPAIEREETTDSLDADPNAIRLVGGEKVGLYVLGLQEVEDLNLATQYMRGVVYSDPGTMDKWKVALEAALPKGYELVACEQLLGLLLLVYASPDVAPSVSNVSLTTVGTGLLGYMGNKGAVAARIVVGETTRMTFINCHLASGHDATYLDRRIWDVGQILSRAQFKPVTFPGSNGTEPETIGDEDFAFWFGDLNFRMDGLPGDDIRRLLMLHTRGEYGLSRKGSQDTALSGEDPIVLRSSESSDDLTDDGSAKSRSTMDPNMDPNGDDSSLSLPDPDEFMPDPSEDPASLQATLDSLLPHDQLRRLVREGKVFHEGWREGPITFLPSYKYDVGTVGLFDTSEKKRAPSWCDRILYRTRKDKDGYEQKIKDAEDARKKDEDMKSRGIDHAADDDEVLFDYDPDNDGDHPPAQGSSKVFDYDEYDEDGDEESGDDVITKEGFHDHIHLDIYTSHQRVQSSDHKPVISVFTLDYDAAVPELKAKVLADVARELDRAENEGRPAITIVMEHADRQDGATKPLGPDLADNAIDFGEVNFLKKKKVSMTLANTGRVPARFSFVGKPTTDEQDGDAQWLTTIFLHTDLGEQAEDSEAVDLGKEVTLEPGETVKAVVEMMVDEISLCTRLNDGQASLDDVLVLRVEEGRDHFIPVRATWMPTCIGRSIDELIRVPDGGIRTLVGRLSEKKDEGKGSTKVGSIPYEQEVRCAAPKELFKLTEAVETLTERALADEQMLVGCELPRDKPEWPFAEPGSSVDPRRNELAASIIDMLDLDKNIADAFEPEVPTIQRLEAVTEVLLLLLGGLTDGVIPISLWTRIEQASLPSLAPGASSGGAMLNHTQDEDDKTAVLDILASAPNHNISFVFLMSTLAKLLAELSPFGRADMEALRSSLGGGAGARSPVAVARRSLSFRRGPGRDVAEAIAALEKRQAKERRFAEALVKAGVCRAPQSAAGKDKERKAAEEKQRALLALFLRRSREEL
ncbi:hypothetical protein RB597_000449 [Gaeumannomyces tritici]